MISPSASVILRVTRLASSSSWVTMRMVLPSLTMLFEEAEDGVGGLRIEIAGWLVGDDERRIVGHGAGDGDALLLPAGDFVGQLVGVFVHVHLFAADPWRALRVRLAVYMLQKSMGSMTFSMQESMGRSWKNWKMTPMLRPRHSAIGPSRRLWIGCVADEDLAGGGPVDAGDHVDQRGLAAARLADDGDKLAGADVQVNVAQRDEFADGRLIGFGHVVEQAESVVAAVAAGVSVMPLRLPLDVPSLELLPNSLFIA